MKGARSRRVLYYTLVLPVVITVSSLLFLQTCHALTASYGEPSNGYLVNGVVFPNMFPGYQVQDYNRAYTTPELAGALLNGIEAVKAQFPGTCDVFIGDFSQKGGGRYGDHVSHQNGRDVDVGLYAKDNCQLHSLIPMNRNNLDPAKTLFLIENLVASQRVQYIFLDRSIQKVLYDYGLSHGYTEAYLNRLFGNCPGALVEDIPGHVTHMHVRFFTPWSTLAAHIGPNEAKMDQIIEVAQESYLPKKIDYFVNGSEKGIEQLAKSFGVSREELCAWNHITPFSVLAPGSCLVYYRRNFESGPVQLANSLQPGYIAQVATPPVKTASLAPRAAPSVLSDSVDEQVASQPRPQQSGAADHTVRVQEAYKRADIRKSARPVAYSRRRHSSSPICFESDSGKTGLTSAYYRVTHGGTMKDVARKIGIPLSSLCRLNRLGPKAHLRHGQLIKLAQANLPVRPSLGMSSCAIKYPARKAAFARHAKSRKVLLKSAKEKLTRKPAAVSRSLQRRVNGRKSSETKQARAAIHKPLARHAAPRHEKIAVHKPMARTAHSIEHHAVKKIRREALHTRAKKKSAARLHAKTRLARK